MNKTMTKTAERTTALVADPVADRTNQIAPLVQADKKLTPLPPVAGIAQSKKDVKQLLAQLKANLRRQKIEAVAAELDGRTNVQHALTVADAFRNLPPGTGLVAVNNADPAAALRTVIARYGNAFQQFEVAIQTPLDPETIDPKAPRPVDDVAEIIAGAATSGVMIHVVGAVRPGTFEELMQREIDRPLLGSGSGRDAIQTFVQNVVRSEKDPTRVTAHSMVGAFLGKVVSNDKEYGPGEPTAGVRDDGSGPKGGLKCGVLAQEFTEEQRNHLATIGRDTAREWRGVADVVVVCNRSLRDGDGIYIYASTVRQRQQIQAVFHATSALNIWHSGRRDDKSLEKTLGAMTRLLNNLIAEGYLVQGQVKINRKTKKVLLLDVLVTPERPCDKVLLEYFSDEH
jgi:hypothetical protein